MDRQCHFTPIIATIVPVIGTLVAPLKLVGGMEPLQGDSTSLRSVPAYPIVSPAEEPGDR